MDITLGLLVLLLLIREGLHFLDRRDMLDRLMAKSLPEFKEQTQPEENKLDEPEPDFSVPIEDAEEELTTDGQED